MAESSPLFGFDPTSTTVVGNYSKVAEAQGDIADAAAKSKSQQAPFNFLGIGQQVTQIAGTLAEEKNMIDAHQAKLRAIEFMQKNEHLTGHEQAAAIEEQIKSISEGDNFSSGYRQGALAVFDVGYKQALALKEEERITSSLNVVSSNFSTQLATNQAEGIPMTGDYAQEWATNTAAKMKLPIEYVRNAMVGAYYQDGQMRVATARNKAELAEAEAYIANAGKVLRTPLFLDSRSKKFQPTLTSLKSNLDSSITAKKTEFKDAAASFVVTELEGSKTDVWSTYPKNPEAYVDVVRESTSTPAEFERKMRELRNGYREAQAARVAIGSFDPYAIKPTADSTAEGYKEFKKAADQMVYQEVYKSFGNPSQFIELVNRNPDNIEFSGDRLLHAFNVTEDPAQLGQMKEAIDNIMSMPGGARALQAAFRDDFKTVVGVSALADVYTNGDVAKAKSIFAESKGALVQGTIDPNLKERMYENSTSLGTLGDEYLFSVNTLLNVNSGIVDKKMLDRLYDQFAEGYQERNGVMFDVSRNDTAASAYDADLFTGQAVDMVTKMNGGVAPMQIRNLRNNIMTYTDEFGFASGTFNANPVLNIGNKLYEAMAANDAKEVDFWTRSGDTFDVMTTWMATVTVGTNIFDTEGQLAADTAMYEGLSKVWSGSDVDKEKVGGIILSMKAMFPEVISKEDIPDYDQRMNMQARNLQLQQLVEEMATRFIGHDINQVIAKENADPNLEIQGP